jgi:hypothetical protein
VTLATSTPGTYTVTYTVAANGACAQFTTTASITIDQYRSASFSYAGSPYCQNMGTASVTLSGFSGGTFSSTPGLSLNASTGAVTLATSTPGTYTVTYTIAANGACAQFTTTASITIDQYRSASFSYAGSPYCQNMGTASVTLSGFSGGTFSSTPGLSLNSANGDVTLATSTPGTYTVTYTIAANGACAQFTTTASITIDQYRSASFSYAGSPYCQNMGTASVTLSGFSGGTFSSTPGLSLNSANGDVTLATSTPGTYTVTYTIAANGACAQFTTTASITIDQYRSASFSYAGSPYCQNMGTASVTLSGFSGGTFSSTPGLSLNASTGAVTLATSTPGTYTVTYTIAANGACAQFTTTASITIDQYRSASFSYAGSPYCQNMGTASVTLIGFSGGTFSSTPGLSLNASTGAVTLATSTPGTYTVTYTIAANGACAQFTTTASITIDQYRSASFSYAGSPYCQNMGTASVMLIGFSGGTFSSAAGLSLNPANGDVTLATSTPGTYTVTYTIAANGACAQFTTTASITIDQYRSASFSYAGSPYCQNMGTASVTLIGFSGGTFSSTPGLSLNASTGAVTLATSTPGTYTVTYTIAANGACAQFTTTASITIDQYRSASFSYAGSPYCQNMGTASVTLSGFSGGTFSSTPGLSLNSANGDVTLATSTPGTYTVTYTIAASGACAQFTTTASITIDQYRSASFSYAGSPYCQNMGTASVTLSGFSGGTFSSTPGLSLNASTGDVTLATSTPGTYTVTYTIAANGACAQFTTTASITIDQYRSASFSYAGSPYCQNMGTASITLSGFSGGTFSSAAGLSLNSANGDVTLATSTPGTYTVTYTIAANGACAQFTTTASITIDQYRSASFSYAGSPYCQNMGTASVTLSGFSGGTFSSTPGLSLNASTGDVTLATSTPGTYTVTYTIAANGACAQFTTTASITIDQYRSASFSYAGSPYCQNMGTASVTLSGFSGGTFSSAPGLSLNASTGDVTLATSTPGTYTVTYTIAANGACAQFTTTASITIDQYRSASFSYAGSPYCQNMGTASVTLSGFSGGTFSSTAGLSLNPANGDVTLATSTPGTYTVTYTIAANGACAQFTTTGSITVNEYRTASISYGGSPYCSNGGTASVTLSGFSGGTFSSAAGLSLNSANGDVTLATSTPGTYTVTYTIDPNGACAGFTTTASITITQLGSATISYPASPYCFNSGSATVTFSGTAGGSYSSTAGLVIDPTTGAVNLNSSIPGTYTVSYTIPSGGGCSPVVATTPITINNCSVVLTTKVFIEGFYQGGGVMNSPLYVNGLTMDPTECDYIQISAMSVSSSPGLVDSVTGMLHTNGNVTVTFGPNVIAGQSYYIRVRHRNGLETWSKFPVVFTNVMSYDFTTAASKAYDDNQQFRIDAYAIFSGDVGYNDGMTDQLGIQDGMIEATDYILMEQAIGLIKYGYIVEDLTGDGIAESEDYVIIENNIYPNIFAHRPY